MKFDIAIFPKNYFEMFSGGQNKFTPTRQEVDKAEAMLRSQLEILNKPLVNQTPRRIIHKKLRKYRRQYFGYIDSNGQRILFINCFWKNSSEKFGIDWLKKTIMVLDGGSSFWNVKFNLDTNELFDLRINGVA